MLLQKNVVEHATQVTQPSETHITLYYFSFLQSSTGQEIERNATTQLITEFGYCTILLVNAHADIQDIPICPMHAHTTRKGIGLWYAVRNIGPMTADCR